MDYRLPLFALMATTCFTTGTFAAKPEPVADALLSKPFELVTQSADDIAQQMASCASDATGAVTVYVATDRAQVGIDVMVDDAHVANLTSHYPDERPPCMTASSNGLVTMVLPVGEHTMEARSLNLAWPEYRFSIEQCDCVLIPLR